jgi:hypothetical protein
MAVIDPSSSIFCPFYYILRNEFDQKKLNLFIFSHISLFNMIYKTVTLMHMT